MSRLLEKTRSLKVYSSMFFGDVEGGDLLVVEAHQDVEQVRAFGNQSNRRQRLAVVAHLLLGVLLLHLLHEHATQFRPVDVLVSHRVLEGQTAQFAGLLFNALAVPGLRLRFGRLLRGGNLLLQVPPLLFELRDFAAKFINLSTQHQIAPAEKAKRQEQGQKRELEEKLFHWWAYPPVLTCRAL